MSIKITTEWMMQNAAGWKIEHWQDFLAVATEFELDEVREVFALTHMGPCWQKRHLRRIRDRALARAS